MGRTRIAGVRKILVALAVVAIVGLAAAGAAGGDRTATRVKLPGRLSVRVPASWYVLRGWLSDVTDPAPRLAVASFPATLSRHTCECGFPNVVNFPHDGAFVFVWEYLGPFSHRALARVPHRPVRFHLAGAGGVHYTCDGSSDTFGFKHAGRVFQVEVYLGPALRPALRDQVAAMLDSLLVPPTASEAVVLGSPSGLLATANRRRLTVISAGQHETAVNDQPDTLRRDGQPADRHFHNGARH